MGYTIWRLLEILQSTLSSSTATVNTNDLCGDSHEYCLLDSWHLALAHYFYKITFMIVYKNEYIDETLIKFRFPIPAGLSQSQSWPGLPAKIFLKLEFLEVIFSDFGGSLEAFERSFWRLFEDKHIATVRCVCTKLANFSFDFNTIKYNFIKT